MNAKSVDQRSQVPERKAFSARKYDLLRAAQSILYRPQHEVRKQHRTCFCHRGTKANRDASVWRRPDGSSAYLAGVTTCGSPWTCPVCAAKIASVRQTEISRAMATWIGTEEARTGNQVFLMTLTFPHGRRDQLEPMLELFAKALQRFKQCKTYRRLMGKGAGTRLGSIRSLEVTWGEENGWHPHTHDLVFGRPGLFNGADEVEKSLTHPDIYELKMAWCNVLLKIGLCTGQQISDVMRHGLDVRGGEYAADYVAKFGRDQKWGMSREISMHVAKQGTDNKGAHPFQLLTWAANGDGQCAELFREYADAFHGKRMQSWSPGLKREILDEDEIDDETAADLAELESERIGSLSTEALSVITARHALGEFLVYVARHCISVDSGQDDIDEFIAMLRARDPRRSSGVIKEKMSKGYVYYDAEISAGASSL